MRPHALQACAAPYTAIELSDVGHSDGRNSQDAIHALPGSLRGCSLAARRSRSLPALCCAALCPSPFLILQQGQN